MPVKFSVVIPTYNREKFILQTLESVLVQTYPHREIIVIDDCSTDRTAEVIKPLVDEGQIRYIRFDRNYERCFARNTGMENATGDFVTFLDSDDLMYHNNLADAADFIAKNPEYKCFHNLYKGINEKGEIVYNYRFPPLDNHLKAIVGGNFMNCIGNFIHREIYEKYRFDTFPDLIGTEDWDFWLRVFADFKVGRIEKVNNGFVQHSNRSVNNHNISSVQKGFRYMSDKFAADPHLSKVYAPYLNRIESNSNIYLATLCVTAELYDEARVFLREAVKKDVRVVLTKRFLSVLRRAILRMPIQSV